VPKRAADLLLRPAAAAAAELGLARLDGVRAAGTRVDDPDDAEALHDFRVALRRLRALLRSFLGELGDTASKKLQRRLRDLTRATSGARDAEVQLAWLQEHRGELGLARRPGLPWLVARLEGRRDGAYVEIRRDTIPAFRQLERRLRRALNAALADVAPERSTFGAAMARLLREHVATLEQELTAAQSARDADAVHGARIAAKRLRYLLEPVADGSPRGPGGPGPDAAIEELQRLQTLLGDLHDVQVLLAELGEAAADAAAERARRLHAVALRGTAPRQRGARVRPRPASAGPLALARLASGRQDELFRRLDTEWSGEPLALLAHQVRGLAAQFAAAALPAPRLPAPRRRSRHAPSTGARPQ
jgi:CHAD domain-containing protein